MFSNIPRFILLVALLGLVQVKVLAQTQVVVPTTYLSEVLQISTDSRLQSTMLVADKTTRNLFVFEPNKNLQNPEKFEIDIGKNDGNKTKRNDKKTPEGIYLLETKLMPPQIPFETYGAMAFTTNYPNVFDKFENKTGDGIWLHSVPDNVPLNRGSKGCVVLRNNNLKKVESLIALNKSFLIIEGKVEFISEQTFNEKKQRILNWLDQWKSTWQKQDLQNYIKMYSDNFSAPPSYTKSTWLAHKEKLKERYKFVKIELSSSNIFNQKSQYILRFIQDYESDGHKDTGLKSLYLVDENGELKVLREEWKEI